MPLKKIAYSKEPKLKVHKYVVTIGQQKGGGWKTQIRYCVSLKEVKAIANKAPKFAIVEVYSAVHNFIQAYAKV